MYTRKCGRYMYHKSKQSWLNISRYSFTNRISSLLNASRRSMNKKCPQFSNDTSREPRMLSRWAIAKGNRQTLSCKPWSIIVGTFNRFKIAEQLFFIEPRVCYSGRLPSQRLAAPRLNIQSGKRLRDGVVEYHIGRSRAAYWGVGVTCCR